MTVYQISYDLNRPGQDYPEIIAAIKALGPWAQPLKSMWLVDSSRTAHELYAALKSHIDRTDGLLISRVTPDYAGWLNKSVIEWLQQRVV